MWVECRWHLSGMYSVHTQEGDIHLNNLDTKDEIRRPRHPRDMYSAQITIVLCLYVTSFFILFLFFHLNIAPQLKKNCY